MSTASFENNPKVTILLLNYNGWRDAIECLESIYQITYPNWEVIFVDNGSMDGSVSKIKEWAAGKIIVESIFFEYDIERKPIKYIKELFYDDQEVVEAKVLNNSSIGYQYLKSLQPYQKLLILRIETNRGFTGGNNIGIKYILKEIETDYILLLSNDTVVDKMFLSELVRVAESDEMIGIVGPKIYYYDFNGRTDIINFAGADINWNYGNITILRSGDKDNRQFYERVEVDYVAGCALLAKKELIEKIGYLKLEYFAYWEETDWCVRAHKAGYKIICVPTAKIWHKIASTTRKTSGFVEYHMTRNMFWFMREHATRKQYITFLLHFFGMQFWLTSSVHLVFHKDINAFIAFVDGIKDGIKKVH